MSAPGNVRVVAVDWSGAASGERKKIWLAEVRGGALVRLESGRSRTEVIDHLMEESDRGGDLIVGLDFAFSLPAWFVGGRGLNSVDALWKVVATEGETWLAECEPPFWGRPGKKKPKLSEHLRVTERDASVAGIGAKSVFQIGGAGAVGTGSLRGMPHLARLRAAGFSIWPFHEVHFPLVIEIYPRLLTGPVVKSSQADREQYLSNGFPEIGPEHMPLAASSEDAFDAAVSAVIMARHRTAFSDLERAVDDMERLEGRIWAPDEVRPGKPDTDISGVELTNVSQHGLTLLVDGRERYLPYDRFPWFRHATIAQLSAIERPTPGHLHWVELDVDLTLESIDRPEDFPLVSRRS